MEVTNKWELSSDGTMLINTLRSTLQTRQGTPDGSYSFEIITAKVVFARVLK